MTIINATTPDRSDPTDPTDPVLDQPKRPNNKRLIAQTRQSVMKRWPLTLLILVVLIVGGRFIYGILHHPDDKTQIQAALADAVKASREGRPGSVVDKLADNIKLNGAQQSLRQIADVVVKSHPDVTLRDTDPVVSGDTAQITSDVTVKADFMGTSKSGTFKDAQLMFKKESAMDWIIFPTTKWVLSDVRISPTEMPEIQ